jgi:hypothetical protein
VSAADERAVLNQEERQRLATLADTLIAGGEGLPAASKADVQGKWIDRTLAARPDLTAVVQAVLALTGEPQAVLERLRAEDPLTFDTFSFTVCGAYLINPRVRKLLGYPGQAPKASPAYPDESDHYLQGGLIDPVIERGPIYRPTPAGDGGGAS